MKRYVEGSITRQANCRLSGSLHSKRSIDSKKSGLKLWDASNRFYRYAIATSVDGKKYVPLVDRSQGEWRSWQVINFPKPRPVKFVKIFGLYNSANEELHVIEFEAYTVSPKK